MIIAFMGELASGKDYFTDHLVKNYGATRLSYSDEVRRLATTIFPWLPFFVPPEIKDIPFNHPSNPNNLTPRQIWLTVGKVRDVDPYYFVEQFVDNHDNEIFEKDDQLYIITDFRTPQENEFQTKMRIPVIKIERENREGLPHSDFEEYVRQYKDYDALFINKMNGTEEFDEFFKEWRKRYESTH